MLAKDAKPLMISLNPNSVAVEQPLSICRDELTGGALYKHADDGDDDDYDEAEDEAMTTMAATMMCSQCLHGNRNSASYDRQ